MSIRTISFCDHFIPQCADYIEENYLKKGKDLRRLAVIFGGKRPALFLKRELAVRLQSPFYPPRFFTIDEFVSYSIEKQMPYVRKNDLESCYAIYQLAGKKKKKL
ncbi:MAG: hypothetical protein KC713_04800, partial [Candidatus Omnitrophica bacterium]|nr:hypothetical protein [Candidatus Omnitrophota bacterium]